MLSEIFIDETLYYRTKIVLLHVLPSYGITFGVSNVTIPYPFDDIVIVKRR
jgi:hypothetical protein